MKYYPVHNSDRVRNHPKRDEIVADLISGELSIPKIARKYKIQTAAVCNYKKTKEFQREKEKVNGPPVEVFYPLGIKVTYSQKEMKKLQELKKKRDSGAEEGKYRRETKINKKNTLLENDIPEELKELKGFLFSVFNA